MSWFCNLKGILSSLVLFFTLFITEVSAFASHDDPSIIPFSVVFFPSLPVLAATEGNLAEVAEEDINNFSIPIPAHIEMARVTGIIKSHFWAFSDANADLRTSGVPLPQERDLIINIRMELSVDLFERIWSVIMREDWSRDVIFRYSNVHLRFPGNALERANIEVREFLTVFQNEMSNLGVNFILEPI